MLNPEIVMTETITDLCTDYVAGTIINVAFNLQGIINNVGAQSRNRAFDSINLLQLSKLPNLLSFDDTAEIDDPNITTHIEDLKRHLAGFGLEIDGIDEDGDCAFRSIVRHLSKIDLNKNKEVQDHLLSLNLISRFEEGDTFTLRQLFVEELLKGQNEFSVFVSETTRSFTEKANEFKNRGVFDREIGDLTMKVCSNVLKIPVIHCSYHIEPFYSCCSFILCRASRYAKHPYTLHIIIMGLDIIMPPTANAIQVCHFMLEEFDKMAFVFVFESRQHAV